MQKRGLHTPGPGASTALLLGMPHTTAVIETIRAERLVGPRPAWMSTVLSHSALCPSGDKQEHQVWELKDFKHQ